jgi:hypothetical protein
MSLATTPTNVLTGSARQSARVARRWEQWRYLAHNLTVLQNYHEDWVAELLARGVDLPAIRRNNLDDPREPRSVLEARVAAYTHRKRRRNAHSH